MAVAGTSPLCCCSRGWESEACARRGGTTIAKCEWRNICPSCPGFRLVRRYDDGSSRLATRPRRCEGWYELCA